MAPGEKVLWKREPWIIVRIIKTNRIRVDHGMHSDWPVMYRPTGRPWHVAWDRPEVVPKDVMKKVHSILLNDHGHAVKLAHDRAYGRGSVKGHKS